MQLHQLQTASMVEKNCFDMTKLFFQIMCVTRCVTVHGAVVKEFLARADKPRVRLPATLLSVSLYRLFSLFCLFLTLFFLLAFFSLFLLLTLLVMHLYQYILSLRPEFYFGKGISKALDLHTGQSYDQKKKHKLSRHVPPLKQLNVFQCS